MCASLVRHLIRLLSAAAIVAALVSCEREERQFHVASPSALATEDVPWNNRVRAGPISTTVPSTTQPVNLALMLSEPYGKAFPKNAQALSDGQVLYESFNCVGCHAHGGGGMAPPLIDNKWFYGEEPYQVYQSIVEGRPNGMPSFRGRIPDYQVWELVAYVRSLSGRANPNAASGREDHMTAQPPPNSIQNAKPQMQPAPTTGPVGGAPTGLTTMPTTTTTRGATTQEK